MRPIRGLRTWWQYRTGEEETPFDGDAPVWLTSMLLHLGIMFAIAYIPIKPEERPKLVELESPFAEEFVEEDEIEVPDEFHFDERVNDQIGAFSHNGTMMALSTAAEVSDISIVPSPVELTPTDVGDIEFNDIVETARGLQFDNLAVKGHVGEGTTGALGAVDRITHEILMSMEERKTLVVWLFDQSGSLTRQRKEILKRFDRVYQELGVIEAAGSTAFAKYEDKPLLTSVAAFGDKVNRMTKKPTDNLAEIKKAVAAIQLDKSGNEMVFTAVSQAAEEFKKMRYVNKRTGEPDRNVMIVVFSDEVGDDQEAGLDATVKTCRRYEVPVYVVGVPAPFGRGETLVKWVDPDPSFDQTPQWGRVNQGPESFYPERIKLNFAGFNPQSEEKLDSGFGPYSLTRLCYETGGIYFAVHPNRATDRGVRRRETAAFSAHITRFFDPDVMRKYRPDYVSRDEYLKRVSRNNARGSLVKAAQLTWLSPLEGPETRFERQDEAAFNNALTDAQKAAASLEPKVNQLFEILKLGEAERELEATPRWQAGYDLAMGRVMAAKIRTESYNAMLAMAKRGLKPKNPKTNLWNLESSDEIGTGSGMVKVANKAKNYLERVVADHPGTPWALLAERELKNPMGWKWQEGYIPPPPPPAPRPAAAAATPPPPPNNRPRPARNEMPNKIARPKPKRPAPRL